MLDSVLLSCTLIGTRIAHPDANSDSVTFVGLLIYSIVGYNKAKNIAKRGNYVPAHNPAAPMAAAYPPQYQQSTAYHSQTDGAAPMQSQYIPPYQAGIAGDYYNQQPVKPAHMV